MKGFQRYRFPSLRSLQRPSAAEGARTLVADLSDPAIEARIEEGYRQGTEEGYRAGFERGEADGLQQGRDTGHVAGAQQARDALRGELAGVADTLDAMREAFARMHAEYLAARRTELVDLVAKVAKQVIRCELTLQPGQMVSLIEETLASMPVASGTPEVHLNPGECARLSDLLPERARHWRLVADARLEAGECRVMFGGNEADAGCQHRLDACMERVGEQLLGAPAAEAPAPAAVFTEEAS